MVEMSKKKSTYQKLLESASECFSEKGFSATSIREIATRAGISQGAMYTYFKSKEELFIAIVEEEQRIALGIYSENYEGSDTDRLYDMLFKACLSENPLYPEIHNPLWLEIMAESSRNETLRQYFIYSDIVLREGIHKFLVHGMQTGEFRGDLELNEVTMVIFAMIDGLMGRKAINPAFVIEKDIPGFKKLLKAMLS